MAPGPRRTVASAGRTFPAVFRPVLYRPAFQTFVRVVVGLDAATFLPKRCVECSPGRRAGSDLASTAAHNQIVHPPPMYGRRRRHWAWTDLIVARLLPTGAALHGFAGGPTPVQAFRGKKRLRGWRGITTAPRNGPKPNRFRSLGSWPAVHRKAYVSSRAVLPGGCRPGLWRPATHRKIFAYAREVGRSDRRSSTPTGSGTVVGERADVGGIGRGGRGRPGSPGTSRLD